MLLKRKKIIKAIMITFKCRLFIVMFFCSMLWSSSAFSQTLIKVVDQNNTPLPNAVIEVVTSKSIVANDNKPDTYVMDQVDKAFAPEVLVVPVNSLVSFPNSDDIRHHVYSFSPAKTFELKLYSGKPKSPVRFDNSGVVVMGCNIHDAMVGYIYVTDREQVYITDKNGEVAVNEALSVNSQLQVWHAKSTKGVEKQTLFTLNQEKLNQKVLTLELPVNTAKPRDSFEELALHEH